VNTTLFVPMENGPDGLNDRLVIVPSLSNEPASTADATAVAWQFVSAATVILLHSATGGWLGAGKLNTITWNVHEFVLAAASIAVQVTMLVPSANALPDAGVQLVVRPRSCRSWSVRRRTHSLVLTKGMFVTTSPAHEMLGTLIEDRNGRLAGIGRAFVVGHRERGRW